MGSVMPLSIAYHARLEVTQVGVDNVIEFPDNFYLGLRSGDQLDNSYDFFKKYLTVLKIL